MKSLIIGGSSNLGNNIVHSNLDKFDFTYFRNKKKNGIFFDILGDKKKLPDLNKYKSVIILSAVSNPNICQNNPKYSNDINVYATIDLIKYVSTFNLKVIFFSSEFIYDGAKGNYDENDLPNPINLYGRQKLEVENFILKNIKKYSILRIAKTYTNDLKDNSFFSFIHSEIIKKKKDNISVIDDEFFSPLHIDDLIKTLLYSIEHKVKVLNVGGPERKSRLNCIKNFLDITGNHSVKINLYKRELRDNIDYIPKDVSFNVNKLKEINRNMITIKSYLKKKYSTDYGINT